MGKQIIASCDPLYDLKRQLQTTNPEYSFFEHDINQEFNIGVGNYNGVFVREKIITDGKLSLQKRNPYSPMIIWQNVLLTLKDGLSITIDVTDATFMIDIIKFGDKREYEIHLAQEDEESIRRVISFLNGQAPQIDSNSISFKSPSLMILESMKKGKHNHENLDFKTGHSYSMKKGKSHKRH